MFHANILLALWPLSALPFCVLGRHVPVEPRSRSRESGKAFLTDLYHKHFDEHGEIKRINSGVSKIIHAVQGKVDVRSSVIRFSTQRIIPEEVIQKAEIQVKVVCSEEQHPSTAHPIRLGLYDQMTAELISQALLRTAHPSWVVFPIQSIVVHWLRSLNTTRGVTVEVMENTEGQQNLSKILIYSGKNGSLDEPFMVVHTDGTLVHDVNAAIPLLKNRVRRNAAETAGTSSSDQSHTCSRRNLLINTEEIFSAQVFAPSSFNAYDCAGKCDLSANPETFSNHAILRSFARNWDRKVNATAPCCVPTSLSGLVAVLYSEEEGHAVLRQFQDMIVTKCGCR